MPTSALQVMRYCVAYKYHIPAVNNRVMYQLSHNWQLTVIINSATKTKQTQFYSCLHFFMTEDAQDNS